MNLARVQDFNARQLKLSRDHFVLEKQEIGAVKEISGKFTDKTGQMPDRSNMATSFNRIISEIRSPQAKVNLIAVVFKEELKKKSQSLDLAQISLVMDELIRIEQFKLQELRLEVSQGTSLVLQLLNALKTEKEFGEWIEIVFKRLKTIEEEDAHMLKSRIKGQAKFRKNQ